jgi:hypothetical protein
VAARAHGLGLQGEAALGLDGFQLGQIGKRAIGERLVGQGPHPLGGPTSAPSWTCTSETLPESSIAPAWQLRETPHDDGRRARADEFALARCARAVPWRGRGCVSAGDHWCHSTECNERLPPSPAPSRSTAGVKKRSFLYGPAHRAQMLASPNSAPPTAAQTKACQGRSKKAKAA